MLVGPLVNQRPQVDEESLADLVSCVVLNDWVEERQCVLELAHFVVAQEQSEVDLVDFLIEAQTPNQCHYTS